MVRNDSLYRNPDRGLRTLCVSIVFATIGALAGLILAVFVHNALLMTILGTLLGGFAGTLIEGFVIQKSETNRREGRLLGEFRSTNFHGRKREIHD